jgi:hypothetical protein
VIRQVRRSCPSTSVVTWGRSVRLAPEYSPFLGWRRGGAPRQLRVGGAISDMGCMVPQPLAAGGNRSSRFLGRNRRPTVPGVLDLDKFRTRCSSHTRDNVSTKGRMP